ncbi:MAG TPA: helix-turn-helix domain-containing protein [Rhizobium sp.]|nr:helix-turn-helix domain-containing protein [Rhizobium sp.]
MNPHPEHHWLTTAELAERWRMTTRTLERWRAEPYGPAWHRIGGKVLYLMVDVLAYDDRHRRKGG